MATNLMDKIDSIILEAENLNSAKNKENENNKRYAKETNYFIKAVKESAYEKKNTADLKRVLKNEKKVRANLAMATLNLTGKIKTIYNYYLGDNDKYYPKMSKILNAELEKMVTKSSELETILDHIHKRGDILDNYYLKILEEMDESYSISKNSKTLKDDYMNKMRMINNELKNNPNLELPDKIKLLRARKKFNIEYCKRNEEWATNMYNIELRTYEIKNLHSVSSFINALSTGSALILRFSKTLEDNTQHTKFIYDIIPELLKKEISIEESQQRLADAIIEYKGVLVDLYRHKFNKLSNLVGSEGAKEMLGSNLEQNIHLPGSQS